MGALGVVGALTAFALIGIAGGLATWHGDTGAGAFIGVVALCIGALIGLLSIPSIIAGWGLLAEKSWARVLMIVIGFLDLLHFPLGTALGIYTLCVLLRDDTTGRPHAMTPTFGPAP